MTHLPRETPSLCEESRTEPWSSSSAPTASEEDDCPSAKRLVLGRARMEGLGFCFFLLGTPLRKDLACGPTQWAGEEVGAVGDGWSQTLRWPSVPLM